MLAKGLPEDPMVFTMAHELKHHLADRAISVACCSDRNANEPSKSERKSSPQNLFSRNSIS